VRREVLQELWPLRPAVAELVTMDARAFQSAEEEDELEPRRRTPWGRLEKPVADDSAM